LLILHDINHRKHTETQLRELAEELTELNRMKDRIYSIISHDLRNPFNTILGFSQLLAESYEEFTEADRRHFAGNILDASKNAFNLLENLLEWSLMQLGKFEFAPVELPLDRQVDEAFNLLGLMATGKKIELVNAVSPGHIVFADSHMLAAILRNLISNAVKFTPVGGCIEVSSSIMQGTAEVIVSDNGIGMPPRVMEELFSYTKMQTKQGTANEKGTGLGLLLVRDFVEKNHGTIRVTSEQGKGSRFVFTLPAR
jgi:signal transduction histidine kinase